MSPNAPSTLPEPVSVKVKIPAWCMSDLGLRMLMMTFCFVLFILLMPTGLARTPDLPEEFKTGANGKMILLDFYSPFCGTCQMMEPHLLSIKAKVEDTVYFKRLDITLPNYKKYLDTYDIQGTPTYVLYDTDGKAVYRMDDMISPAILEKQILRAVRKLKQVRFPEEITLPKARLLPQDAPQDLILVAFENKNCESCASMSPYLNGFELTGEKGLYIFRLNTETPGGKQMMESMAIRKIPAYALFDNQGGANDTSRGELFLLQGAVPPKALWDLIRVFRQAGV